MFNLNQITMLCDCCTLRLIIMESGQRTVKSNVNASKTAKKRTISFQNNQKSVSFVDAIEIST